MEGYQEVNERRDEKLVIEGPIRRETNTKSYRDCDPHPLTGGRRIGVNDCSY